MSAITSIVPYRPKYKYEVINLWKVCDLTKPWNNPEKDIERMMQVYPDLFLVGIIEGKVVAAVMGGYDGHRGWAYYLGVDPAYRRQGLGRRMMETLTGKLLAMGCPKVNIQIRGDNEEALGFYKKLGYAVEERVSLGRRLIEDRAE